ncbi:MAG: FkbM family methyltransferase [Flavobacteriales bacterium]|nr:FkbM family methyltransferase [Flavobacteriales bacterium]
MKQLIYRFIYWPPVNAGLLFLNKVLRPVLPASFRLPPTGIITVDTGPSKFLMATNQTCYLTQLVHWNGFRSFEYGPIFKDLIQGMRVFVDVGANTGYYSLVAATISKDIHVHAFEPASGPSHYLKKNVQLNHFEERIHVSDLALSDASGKIRFFETGSRKFPWVKHVLAGDGSLLASDQRVVVMEHDVEMDTLDAYVDRNGVTNIDLIKIDTEGTEPAILAGGRRTIERDLPVIICETLFGTTEKELDRSLQEMDYVIFKHFPDGLQVAKTLARDTDDGVRNCFFVHRSKMALLDRFTRSAIT